MCTFNCTTHTCTSALTQQRHGLCDIFCMLLSAVGSHEYNKSWHGMGRFLSVDVGLLWEHSLCAWCAAAPTHATLECDTHS
jgi:hypothetical protein